MSGSAGKQVELDPRRLEAIFRVMPAAVAVVRGPDHVFEFANPRYERLIGRGGVVGRPVREALPEVERQGLLELLDRVYATGEPYVGDEVPVMLDPAASGELREVFLNFVCTPTRDADGSIDGLFVHAVDVTELVRARQEVEGLARELEDERARLETVLEQMPAAVAIAEAPSGRLLRANRDWRELFGVSVDDVSGIRSYERFGGIREDGRPYAPEEYPLARSIATGETVVDEEVELPGEDGGRRWLAINSAPIRDGAGRVAAAISAVFDVTGRRRTEAMLETHQRILRLVAEGAPLGTALDGLARMIEERSADGALASVLLLDRDGVHLRHCAGPSLPDSYNEAIDGLAIGEAAGSCGTAAYRGERVVVSDIGADPLWAGYRELALPRGLRACWSTPIRSRSGELLGTFAVYYDRIAEPAPGDLELVEIATRTAAVAIERHRLEADRAELLERERVARAEAEGRAQAALSLEYVADGVCLLDGAGVVRLWNPASERLFGAAAGDVLGREPAEAVPGWDAVASQGGPGWTARAVPVERDGHERWLSVARDAFGGGTVYTFRDVTDEHLLEELRGEMLATVSHELRTPLASVYGAAMTLQRQELSGESVPALVEMIGSESERLRVLVDRILLASALERGGGPDLDVEPFDAAALAHSVADAIGADDRVRVRAPRRPVTIAADPERTRQVLANLLDNALKYGGAADPVELRVSRAGRRVRLAVTDRGPGIPEADRARIFDKFFRLDPDMTRGVGGTGLGLYIARELAERMDGRVLVDSAEGAGSTFTLELPGG